MSPDTHRSLVEPLVDLVFLFYPQTDPEWAALSVTVALGDHDLLESPPLWMFELMESILAGEPTPGWIEVPEGYPRGESGWINVLLDIAARVGDFGMDDTGESACWPILGSNLAVYIAREYHRPVPSQWPSLNVVSIRSALVPQPEYAEARQLDWPAADRPVPSRPS